MKAVTLSLILAIGLASACAFAADKRKPATTQAAIVNKKCPISGDDVDPKVKTANYKGKTVGFCCEECIDKFEKDPDKYGKELK